MSAFGSKRKARKITIHNEDDDEAGSESPTPSSVTSDFDQGPALQPTFKTRPAKQSLLRKTIKISDIDESQPNNSTEDDEDGGAPVVVRPSLAGRTGSSKIKKRAPAASKLSFDADKQSTDHDGAFLLGGDQPASEAKQIKPVTLANTKFPHRKGLTKNNRLPIRSEEDEEQEERPRYSKEYLSELQSATPNTPANLESLQIADEDVEMSLDPSELEGATLVEQVTAPAGQSTNILTEAEIQEKKERRARRAQQAGAEDFISFSDDDREAGDSYLSVLAKRQPAVISSKKEKRLVNDDNLDEDDSFFVEDGGLSLGAKAEREARKKKRADMASMIATAEGVEDDETSDDSEAERRAAYESAQTRAGMDGLAEEREQQRRRLARDGGAPQVPPKITPLPDLSVKVQEYKAKVAHKLAEMKRAKAEIDRIKQEREEIDRREPELQQLLNEAGERYRSLMGGNAPTTQTGDANGTVAAAKSLLDRSKNMDTPGRGLESMGTTPLRQTEHMEDV